MSEVTVISGHVLLVNTLHDLHSLFLRIHQLQETWLLFIKFIFIPNYLLFHTWCVSFKIFDIYYFMFYTLDWSWTTDLNDMEMCESIKWYNAQYIIYNRHVFEINSILNFSINYHARFLKYILFLISKLIVIHRVWLLLQKQQHYSFYNII